MCNAARSYFSSLSGQSRIRLKENYSRWVCNAIHRHLLPTLELILSIFDTSGRMQNVITLGLSILKKSKEPGEKQRQNNAVNSCHYICSTHNPIRPKLYERNNLPVPYHGVQFGRGWKWFSLLNYKPIQLSLLIMDKTWLKTVLIWQFPYGYFLKQAEICIGLQELKVPFAFHRFFNVSILSLFHTIVSKSLGLQDVV